MLEQEWVIITASEIKWNRLLNLICALEASDRDVDIILSALSGLCAHVTHNAYNYAASINICCRWLGLWELDAVQGILLQFDVTVLFIQRSGVCVYQTNNVLGKKNIGIHQ